jgi:very-short-patch-repair endonuclease
MGGLSDQPSSGGAWRLAEAQHGQISHEQLLGLGYTRHAIAHRVARGRLHAKYRGVYTVGRRTTTRYGEWMAATLACGEDAVLSHRSAGDLWGIRPHKLFPIDLSVTTKGRARHDGLRVHRRSTLPPADRTHRHGIPVTTPTRTLIDLATLLTPAQLEAAINEADKLDRVDPYSLRASLEGRSGQRGVAVLKAILDRRTFVLTRSELERRFLPIARQAGLPKPETQALVNGFEVDFFWPDLGLVVETDGLRYHRTPAQQAKDRVRDQAHTAAGLTPLRFTHAQVRHEPDHVRRILGAVARRLVVGAHLLWRISSKDETNYEP